MLVVIVSVALLALAVVLCVVWGRERLVEPALPAPASDAARSASAPTAPRLRRHLDGLRLYAWWVSLFLVAATASTLLVTGAGGRGDGPVGADANRQAAGARRTARPGR